MNLDGFGGSCAPVNSEEMERCEDEFERKLLAEGFISHIPTRDGTDEEFDAFEPIQFEGELLSETIIRRSLMSAFYLESSESRAFLWEKFVDILSIYKSGEDDRVVFEEKSEPVVADPRSVGGFMALKLFCVWDFAESCA